MFKKSFITYKLILKSSYWVEKMKSVLQDFIHENQCSYLPKRQLRGNIRNILIILCYSEQHNEKQAALIFPDWEKVFDNF